MCMSFNSVSYSDLGLKPAVEVTSVTVETVSPWSKRIKKVNPTSCVIVSSLCNTGLNCCPLNSLVWLEVNIVARTYCNIKNNLFSAEGTF